MNTPAPPFFFRAADRMRIEGCLSALAQDAMNLAISCEQEALLDHYLDILLWRLKEQAPWLRQEVYFPTNTESLLARFNEILSQQSLREAVQTAGHERDARVWIVHDAQSLPEPELQLLARLIQNFPGANIRALLVMSGPTSRQPQLSAFGRKILKWEIELPGHEQAQLALETAASDTERALIERLLRKMGRFSSGSEAEPLDLELPIPEDRDDRPESPATPLHRLQQSVEKWRMRLMAWSLARQAQHRAGARPTAPAAPAGMGVLNLARLLQYPQLKSSKLVLAAVGLLLCSVLLMVWLQPQAFGIATRSSQKIGAAAVAAQKKQDTTDTPTRPALPATTVNERADPPVQVVPPAKPDTSSTPVGQDWARQLPPLSFVLQHASVTSLERAQSIQKSNPALRQAQIVVSYRPGDSALQYLVLSGPFEPVGLAYEKARSPGMPAATWVRSSKDLQSQLQIPAALQEAAR